MSRLAEEYVFARLAMLEKEHDEHLKGTSATTEKEAENTDGVEFKKEPITAVRYSTAAQGRFTDADYGYNDLEELQETVKLDDYNLYDWATKERGTGWRKNSPIKREENQFDYQLIVKSDNKVEVYASFSYAPANLYRIYDVADYDRYVSMELDTEAKAKAVDDIRSSLRGAIRMLQAKQSNEEEEYEEEDSDE